MPVPIKITAGDVQVQGELNDTDCARMIAEALPIEAEASTWGEEIYFSIDVDCPGEDMQAAVEMGDLGYWPPGSAFCMFFGMTPMSTAEEIRPASPVMVIGSMKGDLDALKAVGAGAPVTVELA
ncbi:MAG: cyclophilin-like fold protein [Armatimonadota bacterium]